MKPQQNPLRLDQQLCFQLYTASRFMIKAYQPFLKPLDLTYPQYLVLLVLWETDALTVGEIGAALHLDSGTLSPLIKRLLAKGLIQKERDIEDERAVRVQLTARGRKLESKAQSVPPEIQEVSQLSASAASQLFATLERFNKAFDAQEKTR